MHFEGLQFVLEGGLPRECFLEQELWGRRGGEGRGPLLICSLQFALEGGLPRECFLEQ